MLVTVMISMLSACSGPSCSSSCEKLYLEECARESAGQSQNELLGNCISECEDALDKPGEVGSYDPYVRIANGRTIELENDRQAAMWMDCVAETACEKIDDGYCMPVW